jgi:hypothetical protein
VKSMQQIKSGRLDLSDPAHGSSEGLGCNVAPSRSQPYTLSLMLLFNSVCWKEQRRKLSFLTNLSCAINLQQSIMAEAIAVISFVSAVWSLADFGMGVVKRLNEFKTNVHDLPQTFLHISDQLPLLIDTVNRLHDQAKDGHLSPQTEKALGPVVEGVHAQLTQLDSVLVKVLPSAKASTWEKGLKVVRSLKAQKTVDNFASVIDRYVSNLTAYQTTQNGDLIKTLINLIERMNSPQLQGVQVAPPRKLFMVRYQTDEDFIGREEIMEEIRRRFGRKNRVAIAGIGGVGYAFQVPDLILIILLIQSAESLALPSNTVISTEETTQKPTYSGCTVVIGPDLRQPIKTWQGL